YHPSPRRRRGTCAATEQVRQRRRPSEPTGQVDRRCARNTQADWWRYRPVREAGWLLELRTKAAPTRRCAFARLGEQADRACEG
ncbi:hypothetical protein, partial [Acinetobacter baumannii]|uniref:hypothetical protein n=1 Tax=Acinetobacter baumannii TaxID=470 RepID=UPI0013D0FE6B